MCNCLILSEKTQTSIYLFECLQRTEWDTLLFYGVIMSIGGLATFGYLELLSHQLFDAWGHTSANINIGVFGPD
jgi:Na+/H+ antiporter NhaD/arsenite permease-like protein